MASSKPVATPLLQPYPLRSGAQRPQWLEDALELIDNGKKDGVNQIVDMLKELHEDGRGCRYIKSLKGLPLFELKPLARGGHKGGARVYFAFTQHDEALIFNIEVKPQDVDAPDPAKIKQALRMLHAYQNNTIRIAQNTTSQDSLSPRWWRK